MNTRLSILCDKFIEAGWLAALILTPLYMNIYTHRMFEPDKSTIVRSLALLMLAFYIAKLVDNAITRYRFPALCELVTARPRSEALVGNSAETGSTHWSGPNTPQSAAAHRETTPLPQNEPGTWLHFIKTPLFISFILFVIAYIISVLFSAVPYNSIWGGYDRMQGLYTSAGYWVIFLMVALNLRTKAQIDRIVITIIFTSIPIVAYAFIQWFGQDPVPWQAMDPSSRTSSTFGNPHFLATYLIIVIPLTLYRFIQSLKDKWLFPVPFILYGLLVSLQVIVVFSTKSYSSIVVMLLGISVFFFIYGWTNRKTASILISIFIFIGGVIYFSLFYIPKIVTIENIPQGIGAVESRPGTSARTKVILWRGVWKLITDKDTPYRFFIGYGPESLSTIYYKNYTMELAQLEGANIHADTAQNIYLNIWVWHGIIGLVSYILILFSLFYMALKIFLIKKEEEPDINSKINLINTGVISAIGIYVIESFVHISIVASITYFWIFIAVIYAIYRIKLFPTEEETLPEINPIGPSPVEPTSPAPPIEPPSAELPNDFVTIYSTHDPAEISIIKLKLHDSNIPFVIQNENSQSLFPGVDGFVQAQIQVLQNNFDNAKLLLQDIVKDNSQIQSPPVLNIPDTFDWKLYLFIGYAVLTVVIAIVMFSVAWPSGMLTPEIKNTRDIILVVFCLWLLGGIIAGIVAWPRWLFWTYAGQTLLLAVIMTKRYWPNDTTNTDLLMIYSWVWLLIGLIIGALSIRDKRKIRIWGNSESVMAGIIAIAAAGFVIITVNLPVLRADGFYKFCFSYDQSAEDVLRSGERSAQDVIRAGKPEEADKIRQTKRNESFQIRLACIKYFNSALRFAPDERAYLNGAGRNFLELAKLAIARDRENNITPENKLRTLPSIKEIIETDFIKRHIADDTYYNNSDTQDFVIKRNDAPGSFYSDFTSRDFSICSYACIKRAYELDPNNFERIIALIRIYRYLGEIDKDKTFIEKALKLCDEARKASPQNTKTDDEIRELQMRLGAMKRLGVTEEEINKAKEGK